MLEHLSPDSRYRRFLTHMERINARQLSYRTTLDHDRQEALVAIDAVTGAAVAVARYAAIVDDPGAGEIAIAVSDPWQRRGLGTMLLNRLAERARAWLEGATAWGATEGAYAAMHRTKPQTAAFGLTDSPAGLAAWIVEKLRAWSDCDGDIERCFTKDEILTNVTLYWLTETIGLSMRLYRANAAIPPVQHARRVEVPSGFSPFPGDIVRPPRTWLERTANVVRVTEPPRGGHFAPFEEPELYAQELRVFFRPYRAAATD